MVPFFVALPPYSLDGTDIQVWENTYYEITLGRTSPQLISIRISKKKDTSKYMPELVVTREMSQIMPESIKVIPAACELNIDNLSTYMRPDAIMNKVIEVLSMPLVGTEVIKHQVIWDDDQGQAVDFDGDGILATVVELEAENLTLTFETGANYISLLTIWSGNVWQTRTRDCEIVFISKEGTISFHDCVSAIRG